MTQCRCGNGSRDIMRSTSSMILQLTASSLAPVHAQTVQFHLYKLPQTSASFLELSTKVQFSNINNTSNTLSTKLSSVTLLCTGKELTSA